MWWLLVLAGCFVHGPVPSGSARLSEIVERFEQGAPQAEVQADAEALADDMEGTAMAVRAAELAAILAHGRVSEERVDPVTDWSELPARALPLTDVALMRRVTWYVDERVHVTTVGEANAEAIGRFLGIVRLSPLRAQAFVRDIETLGRHGALLRLLAVDPALSRVSKFVEALVLDDRESALGALASAMESLPYGYGGCADGTFYQCELPEDLPLVEVAACVRGVPDEYRAQAIDLVAQHAPEHLQATAHAALIATSRDHGEVTVPIDIAPSPLIAVLDAATLSATWDEVGFGVRERMLAQRGAELTVAPDELVAHAAEGLASPRLMRAHPCPEVRDHVAMRIAMQLGVAYACDKPAKARSRARESLEREDPTTLHLTPPR